MKSLEFMYWLQGYFEVCECEQLDKATVQTIKNHLKMVELTDGKQIWPFCSWLQGVFVAIENNEPTVSQTQSIKDKLNGIFEHAVEEKIKEKEYYQYPRTQRGMQLNPSEVSELIKC